MRGSKPEPASMSVSTEPGQMAVTCRPTARTSSAGAAREHVGVDGAGADGVDLQADVAHLLGERAREADDAVLGGAVGDEARGAEAAADGGDIDDAAVAALAQRRQEDAGDVEGAFEVG